MALKDVQARRDVRGIALDQVGISDLRCPISVLQPDGKWQRTVATACMSVDLPKRFKGTHMSRFVEVLETYRDEITGWKLHDILRDIQATLTARTARIDLRFPYFIERAAPVTGAKALMDYACSFAGTIEASCISLTLGVEVPVTSVCPCSKEISDYGAHNQRGTVSIKARPVDWAVDADRIVWLEDLIEVAEGSASCPVYPLLKRPDERYVTMKAYESPVFVEDIVRNAAVRLRDDPRIAWFAVSAKNAESIHHHDAFASVEMGEP
jgi:GTP cyclohydrolase I